MSQTFDPKLLRAGPGVTELVEAFSSYGLFGQDHFAPVLPQDMIRDFGPEFRAPIFQADLPDPAGQAELFKF